MPGSDSDSIRLKRHLKRLVTDFEALTRKKVRKFSKKNVHDLRIVVRRLRVALWLAQEGATPVVRALRKLGRALGKERELTVAIQDATHYGLRTGGLRSKREMARIAIARRLNSKRRKRLHRRLQQALTGLRRNPRLELDVPIRELRDASNSWLRKPTRQPQQYHELRILMKKVRYTLEALGRTSTPVRKLQDTLGREHDLQVLKTRVANTARVRRDELQERHKARRMIKPVIRFATRKLQR